LVTYVSYLGGSGGDTGVAIAVDAVGAAWVTGYTNSTDFPVTAVAYRGTASDRSDVFVTKIFPDGATLEYSTYAGGSETDNPSAIALDPAVVLLLWFVTDVLGRLTPLLVLPVSSDPRVVPLQVSVQPPFREAARDGRSPFLDPWP
jgi:hypothetical protein